VEKLFFRPTQSGGFYVVVFKYILTDDEFLASQTIKK
jgi:hypothetical protein